MNKLYIENIIWKKCEELLVSISEHRHDDRNKKDQNELHFLNNIGFIEDNNKSSPIGNDYYLEMFVKNQKKIANSILTSVLKEFKPVMIICELLWGMKNITRENIFRLLLSFELINSNSEIDDISGFIMLLNKCMILTYSKKTNNISINYNPKTEFPDRFDKVITPLTPYSNFRNMWILVRQAKNYIWWFDKHFHRKGLEPLSDELDGAKVSEVKILLSIKSSDDFRKLQRDIINFKQEMKNKSIDVYCKVLVDRNLIRKIHDRWIISENICYNVPPINSIFKGQYSELLKTDNEPPFDEWWKLGLDIIDNIDEIIKQKFIDP